MLVYGDTNSTLAGGLAAAQARVPVAHVEAGMRSFDRAMPEELNRVLTDHLSDVLLCPSETAVANLEREHVAGRVELVATSWSTSRCCSSRARCADSAPLERAGVSRASTRLSTAHRAGNVDDPARLRALVDLLLALPLPVGPAAASAHARAPGGGGLARRARERAAPAPAPPLGYLEFTALLGHARAVPTDSGGVQKEAYLAGVPCVTLRDTTEWVETVQAGWNVLVDLDARGDRGARAHAAGRAPRALRRWPRRGARGSAGAGRVYRVDG